MSEARNGGRPAGRTSLPRERRLRDTDDLGEAVMRMVARMGRRVAEEDIEGLAWFDRIEAGVKEARAVAIAGNRQSGFLDREIGAQLGITRQSLEQRFPRGKR